MAKKKSQSPKAPTKAPTKASTKVPAKAPKSKAQAAQGEELEPELAKKGKAPTKSKAPAANVAEVAPKKPRATKKRSRPEPEDEPLSEEVILAAGAATGKALVIVESPAKARTINKYLGKNYVVRASLGHIRDLPKGKFGIDVEHGFEPLYVPIRGKSKVIGELKAYSKTARAVYLAPDMDREGEAIAWHLAETLGLTGSDRLFRVVFNEITKNAIVEAFDKPTKLDMHKVDAQQARRVLDRIMGYKLSPLLWKKIAKGLSAGRVQSVAVRLIVEREKEIRAFIKEEYWRVTAVFQEGAKVFQAELRRLGEERIDKNLNQERAQALVERMGKAPLELIELSDKPKTHPPTPPFTTSQLQQKASTLLRFSAKKTMTLAQQLYEGIEVPGEGSVGLITYMRTDSNRVSEDALVQAREWIGSKYGAAYLPEKPNVFRTKAKGAQEAHEAIRPTSVERSPVALANVLSEDHLKLYKLIWNKFVSSQMKPGLSTITTAVFTFPVSGGKASKDPEARFVAQGEVEVFDGHERVFSAGRGEREEQELPKTLAQGKNYVPERVDHTQHFTQPPPRFSEATLVKELEKKGIGRPSTYATIISTIQDRGYVTLETRRFTATELGELVTDQLVLHFGDVIDTEFTANMETKLDRVESGEENWRQVVSTFNKAFMKDLEKAETDMKNVKHEPTLSDKLCDKCNAPMAILFNKRGKFLGCSRYPECKNTMSVDGPRDRPEAIATDKVCEKCSKPMVIRTGSRGRFLACTGFPKCKNTSNVDEQGNVVKAKPTGILCDKCNSDMVIKGSRRGPFLACSAFPKCRNAKPLPEEMREIPKETGIVCELCNLPMVEKTTRWGKRFLACSGYPKCKNARDLPKQGGEPGGEPAAVATSGDSGDDADA